MAKRKRMTTNTTITHHLQNGRGQGQGASYQPWLTVQDVPSQGLTHRIKGWTTGRVHHLFSNLERDVFYILDWSENILDIREQYPLLPIEETKTIAEKLGVRHPTDPRTQHAIVMTTDFLLDVQDGKARHQQARTVKPAEQLDNSRVLEKLEIERCYWQTRNVDWGIVTEQEIPTVAATNIRRLHGYQQLEQRLSKAINLQPIIQYLCSNSHNLAWSELAIRADQQFSLDQGTARTVLYHLFATRQIRCNLSVLLEDEVAR